MILSCRSTGGGCPSPQKNSRKDAPRRCGFPAIFVEMATEGSGRMKLRHLILPKAAAGLFGRATAVFIICATFVAPTASLGFQPAQSELNDQRSELETTDHTRAIVHQLRRSNRGKLNPDCGAGILLRQTDLLLAQRRTIATTQRFESSTDGWTSPLRL